MHSSQDAQGEPPYFPYSEHLRPGMVATTLIPTRRGSSVEFQASRDYTVRRPISKSQNQNKTKGGKKKRTRTPSKLNRILSLGIVRTVPTFQLNRLCPGNFKWSVIAKIYFIF